MGNTTALQHIQYSESARDYLEVTVYVPAKELRTLYSSHNDTDFSDTLKELSSEEVSDIIEAIGCVGYHIH